VLRNSNGPKGDAVIAQWRSLHNKQLRGGKNHLEDLGVDGIIILKWISSKYHGGVE
jgi:hypothetical protein